jgi:hypothetical protein
MYSKNCDNGCTQTGTAVETKLKMYETNPANKPSPRKPMQGNDVIISETNLVPN